MHLADSLTLPNELELARASGELVVFAGAGISMGPPADLPGFAALAREIAEPVVPWTHGYEGAIDRYLGDAERRGVLVQERARERLQNRGGRHTPLHEFLVGIFGTQDQVRLITTNFDLHFSSAARVVFPGERIPHYVGPALPPGRDFRGIVQLHGSLNSPQDRLVLTRGDFGAAYMAEGWATRFLVGVFAQRTVLFTGYSLGDPVIQYLMNALPATHSWFSLCHESECARWLEHGVTPVVFRDGRDGDRFSDLTNGLRRWHWYARASPLDHDRELRRLVALGPPSSQEDADYVRTRLGTEAGRVSFWHAATTVPWFNWAASEGLLDPLTEITSDDPTAVFWGRWCLTHFSSGDRPLLLVFLRRRPLILHPRFATEVALHVWRLPELPSSDVLRQIVALLVSQPSSPVHFGDYYVYLLERLIRDSRADEALALLGWLTRVRLQSVERLQLAMEEEDEQPLLPSLSIRIGLDAQADDLADLLERHGHALAALDVDALLRLGEQRIVEAYELLALARGANDSLDWLSYGRTSIAPSNQDSVPHAEDALILLVRTALDYAGRESPELLISFAEGHSAHKWGLLRRLALYAFSCAPSYSPDDVLARATTEGWARDMWLRPELYRVLDVHYPAASEPSKATFIAALRDDGWWGPDFDEHDAHARFSLSQKLLRSAPESPATRAFCDAEVATHPEWREGDRDGFLTRVEVGWGGDEPSPIEASQMLQWTAEEAVTQVAVALATPEEARDGYSLLGALQNAVQSNASWGIAFLVAALGAQGISDRLITAGLWGLRGATSAPEEKVLLLQRLRDGTWSDTITGALGSLVEAWARELSSPSSPALLDALDSIADLLYERSRQQVPAITTSGWTERAMNHPAGHAAQTWWSVASARDRVGEHFVLTLDDAERTRWAGVLADTTNAGAFARPIVGMASERLAQGDFPWAERYLFPAFDPRTDVERSAQLWDGRLMQSRWSRSTMSGLAPYFSSFLADSATLVPDRSRQLGDVIAMLLSHSSDSSFTLTTLMQFVHCATPEARQAFADGLPRHLVTLTEQERRQLWTAILQPYWRDRRTNVPLALAPEEVREMVQWVVALPEVASDVLAELLSSPGDRLTHADSLLRDWKEDGDWLRAHPTEAAGLIGFLATRHCIEPWATDDAVDLLELALVAGAFPGAVRTAAEPMVPHSDRARRLVERLLDV